MTNIENFKLTFAEQVNKYEPCVGKSLREIGEKSGEYQLIAAMLKFCLGFTNPQIEKMVWGKRFSYTYQKQRTHYRMGGIEGFYSGSAVWTTYNSILFFLQTGWWPMGLDKASLSPPEVHNYTQPKDSFDRRLKVFYYATDNFVVACSGDDGRPHWGYSAVMVKPEFILDFIKKFNNQMQFENVDLDCETADFIGSGYSAVDLKQLAWKLSMK